MRLYLKRAILIFAVMLAVVTYLVVTLYKPDADDVFADASRPTVIVDAGHGGADGGAVGVGGSIEAELNLAIAKKVRAFLEKKCYNVIMIRETADGVETSGESIREKKLSDMRHRLSLVNESGADIFVSIHMNTFSDGSYHGAQVFYSGNGEGSKALAECLQTSLKKLDETNTRRAKKADGGIYLLKRANIPAVIAECGFLSNEKEERALSDEIYQRKLAACISRGIENYFAEMKCQ